MNISKINDYEKIDLSQIADKITWSGEKTQACRSLDFSCARGRSIPYVDLDIMNRIELTDSGEFLFYGYITEKSSASDSNTVDFKCKDRGFWLKKNKGNYSFAGYTPESITQKVCADFGIEVGYLAPTSISVTKYFYGVDLYSIIMTAYTKAAELLGKQYYIRFTDNKLNVFERGAESSGTLSADYNIISAASSVSIENAVSRVAIYNEKNAFVKNVDNADLINLMGVAQEYLKQSKDDNKLADAQKTLKERGISQKITVNNIGNIHCITGRRVYVDDAAAGIVGEFYIDSDTHTWKNGIYTNKLTLSLENLMDRNESGKDKA